MVCLLLTIFCGTIFSSRVVSLLTFFTVFVPFACRFFGDNGRGGDGGYGKVAIRDGRLDAVAWFRHFAPGARGIVWLAYTFAALAKLNTDFLDPSVSCASTTWVLMGKESFHWLPQGAFWEWNAIIATVVAELSLPCLLLIPRWRHVGVLVGVAFHYLISLPPQLHVPDFASMLFAWWLLFLPNTVADRMAERWTSLRGLFPILAGMRSMVVLTPIVFLPMLWFAWGPSNETPSPTLACAQTTSRGSAIYPQFMEKNLAKISK